MHANLADVATSEGVSPSVLGHSRQNEEAAAAAASFQEQFSRRVIESMSSASSSASDAFDGSAEPTVYMSENRMPVMMEFNSTIIYIIFVALILALLFILPGVRKTKLTSFLGLLTLLTVGASILLALEGSHWLTGGIQIRDSPYSSLTSETIRGRMEVNIGLSSANVTLIGKLSGDGDGDGDDQLISTVDYNERFHWDQPDRIATEHIEALRRGLPYPILTVTEFLSQDSEGFNWTRQLRQAGYYSTLALYLSLASWSLMTIVMCVLPVYLPHMMQITGALIMSSVWIYTLIVQSPKSFAFQVGGQPIEFAFGFTYVTTFVAGALSIFAGVILFALQMSHPHEQCTIMDSEQFVNDQKALYSIDLVKNLTTNNKTLAFTTTTTATTDNKNNKSVAKATNARDHPKSLIRTDSVIIPIGDIEENFQNQTLNADFAKQS